MGSSAAIVRATNTNGTWLAVLLGLLVPGALACDSSGAKPGTSTRTTTATGTTGSGGRTGSGGTSATGGTAASGGTSAAGGAVGRGGTSGTGGTTGSGGTSGAGGAIGTGGTPSTGGRTSSRQDAGPDARVDGATTTSTSTATATRADAGTDARADGGGTATNTATTTTTATGTSTATSTDVTPTCTLPAGAFAPNLAVGGGGSSYKESDHFIVFNAGSSADAALNILESAHQCFVEEWCWRSAGLSITESSGTYYKLNAYAKNVPDAAGVMRYDYNRGLSYLDVVPNSIADAGVTVHEFGHSLTLAAKGWVDQGRTGLWWESVANFVADSFQTSPYCAKARSDHGIATGRTIINLNANIGSSYQIIVMNGNHYEAWPFLAYLTYNPDRYPGLGRMVLPDMFRTHKGNNETPLHVLERLSAPVKVQTIVGRYWARMAFVDIGHPSAQQTFLSSRSRLDYANVTAAGNGTYTPLEARRPKYCGANIIPLAVSAGIVSVQITNLGNGQPDSNFTATLAIRPTSDGAVRYVDLPDGAGEAPVASNEEATLVIANTPSSLYLYDPSAIGANDPANAGLNYKLQLVGASPAD